MSMDPVLHSSKDENWRTPEYILDLAREIMGGEFDLDPASSKEANEFVRAERYYTVADDAVERTWHAGQRLWMNPPFGQWNAKQGDPKPEWSYTSSKAGTFVHKLIIQRMYDRSFVPEADTSQACVLIKMTPDAWWEPVWKWATGIALFDHRVKFLDAVTGKPMPNPPQMHMALCYFGQEKEQFQAVVQSSDCARAIFWR